MKDEGRRSRVEQLGIVDAEYHLTVAGTHAQLLPAASQARDDVIGANLVGNQIGHGRERYGRRAPRGLDPSDERPVAFGHRLRLAGQARLADAGVGDDHHPVAPGVGTGRRDRLELLVAAHQRPRPGQHNVRWVPRHPRPT